jgi:hypothetical protein
VEIASIDLGLGPDPLILAVSEFVEVPGPGVVLVDLNGQGMLYSAIVWMDEAGRVTEGGSGQSGTGWVADLGVGNGCVAVTGQVDAGRDQVRVDVTQAEPADSFTFVVGPGRDGWYAGCRSLPQSWPGIDGISVTVD